MASGVPKKGPHWTQTPAGKIKMSRALKRSYRLRRDRATAHKSMEALQHGTSNGKEAPATGSTIPETTLAYALGYVEAWIAAYASGAGVSARTLAFRVGVVLQRKARG